jgi:hypothetical protein
MSELTKKCGSGILPRYSSILNRFVERLNLPKNKREIPPTPAGATPPWTLRRIFEMGSRNTATDSLPAQAFHVIKVRIILKLFLLEVISKMHVIRLSAHDRPPNGEGPPTAMAAESYVDYWIHRRRRDRVC